jgi:hypothetical protein
MGLGEDMVLGEDHELVSRVDIYALSSEILLAIGEDSDNIIHDAQ